MKITYDSEADAMMIYFAEGKKSARTQKANSRLLVDYDNDENLLAIELLNVSKFMTDPSHVDFVNLVRQAVEKPSP